MTSTTTGNEYLRVREAAEEYRGKSYEVLQDVPLDFLPRFRADLIARKDGEVRVIEVKSRSSLAANPQIGEMARVIEQKPGWTFELLLVAEPHRLRTPDDSRPTKTANVDERIDQAEKALASGLPGAALMLAWSAAEASARKAVAAEGIADERVAAGGHAFDQAVFLGVISRDAYQQLTEIRRYRDALAHGLDVPDLDEKTVPHLIDLARQIESENSEGAT